MCVSVYGYVCVYVFGTSLLNMQSLCLAERLAREDGRGRFAEQRKIDTETFGGAGMARRHQGGRGGYRGGRGQQQGQGQGQSQGYQSGPARGPGQGQSYQNGPARGQGQGYQNGPARGRGQGYQNGPGRGEGAQGGRGGGGFQTVPSRGGYRGGGRGGSGPRVRSSPSHVPIKALDITIYLCLHPLYTLDQQDHVAK